MENIKSSENLKNLLAKFTSTLTPEEKHLFLKTISGSINIEKKDEQGRCLLCGK
jgi:hypothetical protein